MGYACPKSPIAGEGVEKTMSVVGKKNVPMVVLAFFYLAFLGVEYLFDEKVANLAGAGSVAMAESAVVGVSVVGFLLYPLALKLAACRIRPLLLAAGGASAACSVALGVAEQLAATYVAGAAGLLCLGFVGAAAHDAVSHEREDAGIASAVGIAYTAAIILQVELQGLTGAGLMRAALLAAACLASAALATARAAAPKAPGTAAPDDAPATRALPVLAAIVALMTCIFSTLNVTLTGMHAAGQVDLGSWPRLLLAASALASGFALDRLSRRYAPVAMALVSTLSCFAIFSAVSGGPALLCAAVFYLGSGAFVVFFTSAFMLAGHASSPSGLWPSAGRVVNNVVSLAVAAPALALVSRANGLAVSAVVLALLAVIYALVFLWLEKGTGPTVSDEPPAPATPPAPDARPAPALLGPDQKLAAFCSAFGLTEREAEVLAALTTSDSSMQDLARQLYMSRTALYRHISSMCGRVGVDNRQALLLCYFSWQPEDLG